jgi:methionine-rich copper-binding protein CopC
MSPFAVALAAGGLAFVTVLLLVVIVRLLARPGRYTARFRVLSVDGHVVGSSFAFTVKAAAR